LKIVPLLLELHSKHLGSIPKPENSVRWGENDNKCFTESRATSSLEMIYIHMIAITKAHMIKIKFHRGGRLYEK